MYTTNYYNTFIAVADGCSVKTSKTPPQKCSEITIASLQFEMIKNNPYKYTSDEIIFHIYTLRNKVSKQEINKVEEQFFSKGQPCFRSSLLAKIYGWGIHSNNEGKLRFLQLNHLSITNY